MRYALTIIAVVGLGSLVLTTCGDSESIRQCGLACELAQSRMQSYSKTDGCRCAQPADGGAQ